MTKWLQFGDKILKKRDIDYFLLDPHNKFISCQHHLGMSYMETIEEFNNDTNAKRRFLHLQAILGIIDMKDL